MDSPSKKIETNVLSYLQCSEVNLTIDKQLIELFCEGNEWAKEACAVFLTDDSVQLLEQGTKPKWNKRGKGSRSSGKDKRMQRVTWIPTTPEFKRIMKVPTNQGLEQILEWCIAYGTGASQVKHDEVIPPISRGIRLRHLDNPLKKDQDTITFAPVQIKKLISSPTWKPVIDENDNKSTIPSYTELEADWNKIGSEFIDIVQTSQREREAKRKDIWDSVVLQLSKFNNPLELKKEIERLHQIVSTLFSSAPIIKVGSISDQLQQITTAAIEKKEYDGNARARKDAELNARISNCKTVLTETMKTTQHKLQQALEFLTECQNALTASSNACAQYSIDLATTCAENCRKSGVGATAEDDDFLAKEKLISDLNTKLDGVVEKSKAELTALLEKLTVDSSVFEEDFGGCATLNELQTLVQSKPFIGKVRKLELMNDTNALEKKLLLACDGYRNSFGVFTKLLLVKLFRVVQKVEDEAMVPLREDYGEKSGPVYAQLKEHRSTYENWFNEGESILAARILTEIGKRAEVQLLKEDSVKPKEMTKNPKTGKSTKRNKENPSLDPKAVKPNSQATKRDKSGQQQEAEQIRQTKDKKSQKQKSEPNNRTSFRDVAQSKQSTSSKDSASMQKDAAKSNGQANTIPFNSHDSKLKAQAGRPKPQSWTSIASMNTPAAKAESLTQQLQEQLNAKDEYIARMTKEHDTQVLGLRQEVRDLRTQLSNVNNEFNDLNELLEKARIEIERQREQQVQLVEVVKAQQVSIQQAQQFSVQPQQMMGFTGFHQQGQQRSDVFASGMPQAGFMMVNQHQLAQSLQGISNPGMVPPFQQQDMHVDSSIVGNASDSASDATYQDHHQSFQASPHVSPSKQDNAFTANTQFENPTSKYSNVLQQGIKRAGQDNHQQRQDSHGTNSKNYKHEWQQNKNPSSNSSHHRYDRNNNTKGSDNKWGGSGSRHSNGRYGERRNRNNRDNFQQ